MTQFIKRIVLFFIFCLCFGLLILKLFSNSHKLFKDKFIFQDNETALFIGDSHVQNSLNDAFIPNHINLSYHAESYYFSYYKLKILLDANPQIKRVYLGFSYHNLSSYYDEYISGEYSNSVSQRYFFILPLSEQIKFMKWNFLELPTYMNLNFKKGFKNAIGKTISFSGGYSNSYKGNHITDSLMIEKRIKAQFYTNNKIKGFSEFNLDYLCKIKNLCEVKNVELVLLNTPKHGYYKSKVPNIFIRKYDEIILQNNFKIIDLSSFNLKDDSFTLDGDHLTKKGSEIITSYFNNYLKILDMVNKKCIY